MYDDFIAEVTEEQVLELERDVWTLGTLISNVIRGSAHLSEEDQYTLLSLGVQLVDAFGDEFSGVIRLKEDE